jgi:hypothetical protein
MRDAELLVAETQRKGDLIGIRISLAEDDEAITMAISSTLRSMVCRQRY